MSTGDIEVIEPRRGRACQLAGGLASAEEMMSEGISKVEGDQLIKGILFLLREFTKKRAGGLSPPLHTGD